MESHLELTIQLAHLVRNLSDSVDKFIIVVFQHFMYNQSPSFSQLGSGRYLMSGTSWNLISFHSERVERMVVYKKWQVF